MREHSVIFKQKYPNVIFFLRIWEDREIASLYQVFLTKIDPLVIDLKSQFQNLLIINKSFK